MSEQQKSVPGAGVTERQEDWTVVSLVKEFAEDLGLSRRKTTWLDQKVFRLCDHENGILWAEEWMFPTMEQVITGVGIQEEVKFIPQDVFEDLELIGLRPEFHHLPAITWLEAGAAIIDYIKEDAGWPYRHSRRSVMWMALDEHEFFDLTL